ncbi:MAG: hypothetical protein WA991_12090 [Ornithinimicrobium sp.]
MTQSDVSLLFGAEGQASRDGGEHMAMPKVGLLPSVAINIRADGESLQVSFAHQGLDLPDAEACLHGFGCGEDASVSWMAQTDEGWVHARHRLLVCWL